MESSLIVVRGVDTDVSPFDAGSYASSGTYVTGLAAKNAATELREKICAKAAQMWTWMPPRWSSMASTCVCPTSVPRASRTATSRCATLPTCASRTSRAATRSPRMPPPACPFRLRRLWQALPRSRSTSHRQSDRGGLRRGRRLRHRDQRALARVQAEGGIAQGIGHALYEIVEHDDRGRLRTGNFMSYKLPTRLDIGSIRVAFEPSYEPTGPFGAKSIGEVVINTPLAAVASAVAHATGHQVRSLPITPEKALLGE